MVDTYILGDAYIGNFPLSQGFGSNPGAYARFGISGHNGIDIACPKGTPLIAAIDGVIRIPSYDPSGFGNRVDILGINCFVLYGHLKDITVADGAKVVKGQLLGYSGNTGNVYPVPTEKNPDAGSHVHFGVYPTDNLGNKTEPNNGFAGAVDPNGNRVIWRITNPTKPVDPLITTYLHGGWYDNPETGKSQRWWVDLITKVGGFLPVGVTEPAAPPVAPEIRDNQLDKLRVELANEQIAHGETSRQLQRALEKNDLLIEELNRKVNETPVVPLPVDPIIPEPVIPVTDPVVLPVAQASHTMLIGELLERVLGIVKRGGGTNMANNIEVGQKVIVAVKDWFKSTTVIFNASAIIVFLAKIVLQGGLITDPDIMAIGVAVVNLINRFRTTAPITPTLGKTPEKVS